jgi:hypothetical protein
MTTYQKSKLTNKVEFFNNGVKVYPASISGNIYTFENGDIILL